MPTRVAIIGGGCAAMTTAYELSRPEHGGRYEVTVYQMGFRLGGKGASGRGPSGRIEEHGLHLWLGFYENAFRLMRACYAELGRDPRTCPIADWRAAFEPAPDVAVVDRAPDGDWEAWRAHFPPGSGLPGEAPYQRHTVSGYLVQAAGLVVELLRSAHTRPAPATPSAADPWAAIRSLLGLGRLAGTAAVLQAAELLRASLAYTGVPDAGLLLALIDAIAGAFRHDLDGLVHRNVELARIWQVVDPILAILRGATRFGLALDPRGFDAINDYEWLDWLRMHGASEASLRSGFVRGIYGLVFAYENGDHDRPQLAAGVALRGSMRMFFTYRGALFWRMTAGMGDIVFAPLYQVLERRGVRFAFFHRLSDVHLGPQGADPLPHVAALDFDIQAKVIDDAPYRPLVDVRGLPCWPAAPDYDQLVDGASLREQGAYFESVHETRIAERRTLRVGDDFDLVVLGIGLSAVPIVAGQLVERSPAWRAAVQHGRTAATQAAQVWMRPDMQALGWEHPQVNLSGFVQPFDTWADMRHLLPTEDWRTPVRSLAYFCSVLDDVEAPDPVTMARHQHQRVRDHGIHFLDHHIGALWPGVRTEQGGFDWDLLVTEQPGPFEHPFDSQFWTANVEPTDRYCLSVPGSIRYRISPLDLHFDNLTVCGDWTRSGLDSGCVESAVMSGLLAAHAIAHSPPLSSIVAYDHP